MALPPLPPITIKTTISSFHLQGFLILLIKRCSLFFLLLIHSCSFRASVLSFPNLSQKYANPTFNFSSTFNSLVNSSPLWINLKSCFFTIWLRFGIAWMLFLLGYRNLVTLFLVERILVQAHLNPLENFQNLKLEFS